MFRYFRFVMLAALALALQSANAEDPRCASLRTSVKQLKLRLQGATQTQQTVYRLRNNIITAVRNQELSIQGKVQRSYESLQRNGIQFSHSIGLIWSEPAAGPDQNAYLIGNPSLPPRPNGTTILHDTTNDTHRARVYNFDIDTAASDGNIFSVIATHFYASKGPTRPSDPVAGAKYDNDRAAYIAATRRKIQALRQQLAAIIELRVKSSACGDAAQLCTPSSKAKFDRANKRVTQSDAIVTTYKTNLQRLLDQATAAACVGIR